MKTLACIIMISVAFTGYLNAQEKNDEQKFTVKSGTRVPLVLVNSVSTKTAQEGDQVYLQTSFPIFTNNRIVIPEGSYVTGTITEVTRPGRIKGKGELYVRFDTLTLRNGVSRDFRGTVSAADGAQENIKEQEGKLEGEATKGEDAGKIAGTATSGATIGAIAGDGKGAGVGAGVGAAVGLATVLLTRGSEVQLLRGSSLEMLLDRDLVFSAEEINFLGTASPGPLPSPPPQRQPDGGWMNRGSRLPF
ncbi:MAG: hypothetical protein A3F68_10030 [Acidobacteria bacterium RIFCSPLOWO2_12_FULL_54_10]|nr:MAG: hypothetical protein A3F68_10030 [Acidobacteria bacterium RIFCSPLOWO2_12_FULL_54_10]